MPVEGELPVVDHWTVPFLARLDALPVPVERSSQTFDPSEPNGRPMRVFVDGRLAVRLQADAGAVTLTFLTGADVTPRKCTRRGAGWEATFAADAQPDEATQTSWLAVLGRFGRKPGEIAAAAAAEAAGPDDAQQWVWENRERLTDRRLEDRDRLPFSKQLRQAFGDLAEDEQKLLQAQWEREATGEGPTVAEQLGWEPKRVLDTYRSAMAKLRTAAEGYQRPRRPRR